MPDQPDITIGVAAEAKAMLPHNELYQCLISTCSWTYSAPPAPVVDPAVLAHVFGPGVMSMQATNQHHAKTERILVGHFNTHTIAEYIAEIGNLTNLVIGLSAQVAQVTEIRYRDQAMLDDLAQPKSGILGQYPTTGL